MIVDGSDRTPYSVRVLGREEHPVASFYSSQKLDPTRGYIQTRDGTLLSYRVVLPDSSLHGAGPYDLVITYSGYQPSLETGDAHQNRPFEQFSQLGYVSLLEMVKTHPHDGHFWQSRSAEVANIKVPTLQVVSWQDPQVGSRAAILYEQFSAGTPVRLVGVNGFHQYWSGAVWEEVVGFLKVYLGDSSLEETARYESQNDFVVLLESDDRGNVRGRCTLPSFATAGDGRRLVFGSDLSPDDADDSGRSSTFAYDPASPGTWLAPSQDQVSFTSDALSHQTIMAGSGSVDLWIAAEAVDVDLQATLSEIRADGQEMLVQSGWLRASHRALDEKASTALRPRHLHTAESIQQLVPGKPTHLRIELSPFAHVFREGSRIRLIVSGPGGGSNAWPWAFDSLPGGFNVRIVHDGAHHSSSVVLPIVIAEDLSLDPSLQACDRVWLQPCRPMN